MARTHNGPKLITPDSTADTPDKAGQASAAVLDPPPSPPKRKRTPAQPETAPAQPQAREEEDDGDEVEEEAPARRRKVRTFAGGFNCPVAPFDKHDDFWMRLSNFTPDEWKYLIAYLWRTDPPFDTKLAGGRPSHIRKIITPFDADDIKAWEGSGGYRIDLVGIDPTINGKQSQQRIFQYFFEIMDPTFPPRLPEGAWIDAPENQANWGWVKKALKQKRNSDDNSPEQQDVAGIIRAVTEATNKSASPSAMESLMPLMLKNLDPSHTLEMLSKLSHQNSGSNNNEAILQLMLKDKAEQMQRLEARFDNLQAQLQQQRQNTEPAGSLLTQLQQQVEIRGLLKRLGAGSGESEDGWVEDLIKNLAPAIPTFLSIIDNRQRAGQPQAPQQPPQQQPQTQQPTAPAAAQPQGPGATAAPPSPPPGVTPEHMQFLFANRAKLERHAALFTEIMPHFQDAFRFEVGADSGNPGRLFATDWFLPRYGIQQYNSLRSDFDTKTLVQLVTGTDQIWQGFLTRPIAEYSQADMAVEVARFTTFIDGFFSATEDDHHQNGAD